MKKLILAVIVSAFVLTGCETVVPADEVQNQNAINAVITQDQEQIKFHGRASWFPNQSKFMAGTLFALPPFIEGNLVITDQNVYFLQWDEIGKEYNVVMKRPISEIENVKIDTFGRNRRLFILSKGPIWDGFCYQGSAMVDVDKTVSAYEHLKAAITTQKNPNH